MDTAEIFVVVIGLVLIAFTLWFFFGGRDEGSKAVDPEGKPLYECPMHPWITSTDPAANCSICGMKLVRHGDVGAQQAPLENAPQSHSHN